MALKQSPRRRKPTEGAVYATLYLLSIPGLRESIRRGIKTPVTKCGRELKW
jgi:hypothetical protein